MGRQAASDTSESPYLPGQAPGVHFTVTGTSLVAIKVIQKRCLSRAKEGT